MKDVDKRIVFGEMRRLMDEMREQIKIEIRDQVKAASRDLYEVLTGLGVIEPEETLWTKSDIINRYNVSLSTINNMMAAGTLPYSKTGGSQQARVRFRPADVRIAFQE
ncbi:MAG: hypothetical protein HDS14_04075 [Bacteroides sp.]|nr:hypothetical protein [Bacteroides sp.]